MYIPERLTTSRSNLVDCMLPQGVEMGRGGSPSQRNVTVLGLRWVSNNVKWL